MVDDQHEGKAYLVQSIKERLLPSDNHGQHSRAFFMARSGIFGVYTQ